MIFKMSANSSIRVELSSSNFSFCWVDLNKNVIFYFILFYLQDGPQFLALVMDLKMIRLITGLEDFISARVLVPVRPMGLGRDKYYKRECHALTM